MRRSGVLLPVSSIWSEYGIGAFSKEAYAFVDFLEKAGQKLWQILPLGPTGYGDSPYQSFSTFAGNPYFIDLEALIEKGWLTKAACESADWGTSKAYVDYEKVYQSRFKLLHTAYENSLKDKNGEQKKFAAFCEENKKWLDDYALFMAIKESLGGISFLQWPDDLKARKKEALEKAKKELAEEIGFWSFLQYLFFTQWFSLKKYANEKGIEIIGDVPIYVALDSADTWANPELFQLSEGCVPKAVAGVPPDAFSADGQLWGNPLYDWEYHKKTGYAWWISRIENCYKLYDVVRIDHFRGFEAYFSIPYGDKTAVNGHWEKGPDYDLFAAIIETLGEKAVIAEDLGVITPPVHAMIERCGYPGMKVLQFAFDGSDNEYLPHNHIKNCIIYTGTHDNQTTRGWFGECSKKEQTFICKYLRMENDLKNADKTALKVTDAIIDAALASVADTAVIPLQDWLYLGSEARINMPSTLGNNWKWRVVADQLTDELAETIKERTVLYKR